MKNKSAEQNWWKALSDWLERHQGRADFLFIYDRQQGRLNRCFDRQVMLNTVDVDTVSKLYQAAAEGHLGLLRPNDLKPQLLTTDPKKIFAPEKEIPAATEQQNPVKTVQESAAVEQDRVPSKPQEDVRDNPVSEMTQRLDSQKLERAYAEQAVTERMREAEAQYRQVIYAPLKAAPPAPEGTPDPSAGKMRMYQVAALEQIVATIRNAVPVQKGDESARVQEQLIAALAQMVLSISKTEDQDEERREREQKVREELLAVQNLFIWAAVSDKRDQAVFEAQMEWLDEQQEKLVSEMERLNKKWKRGMEDMSRELRDMDMAGLGEDACKEKIRDYLDGKCTAKRHEADDGEEYETSGETWGNTLRHFCSFAASEVPLSVRHVQASEQCQKILKYTEELGLSIEDLGLEPQEQMALYGTIEMGKLVEQGLIAQAVLTSGHRLTQHQYRECLRSYLAMKGMEEMMIPHVQAYEKEISTGDGPISALQIVMGNPGFRARDLRVKAGRTSAMACLERKDPRQVARMIREGSHELSEMGQQVIIASCQMLDAPEPVRAPQAPQKGGPAR